MEDLADAEESRSLFKYAACQLIERPPLGWVEKNDQDLVELFRLLDEINRGRRVMTSPSLLRCYPGAPSTGNLMDPILRHPYDARLWDLLATTQLDYDELGTAASIGRSTVRRRLEEYHEAILDFESFLVYERSTSTNEVTAAKPFAAVERGSTPVRRAVGTFARAHSVFFTAVELAGLVERHRARQRRPRRGRR
ncbi:hypothetical protein [Amycolatopsis sp. NPDC051128]|uniref:hypothetical protein n=1 Tax=Amycolatopsis sp. NPDC051128 TaxID=3155412 RepID=UPI00341747D7